MKRFVVASASPRRRELLLNAGYRFEVIPSEADETLPPEISASDAVNELAKRKARSVLKNETDAVVLGCDTVVALDGKILGKPKNYEEAEEMLRSLSGRTHEVYTGVCIADSEREESFVSCTKVEFYPLSDETIRTYINTEEPMDKAGAYGIQGLGSVLVRKLDGDYFTVMGLPVNECARSLARFGIEGRVSL